MRCFADKIKRKNHLCHSNVPAAEAAAATAN
jgi:hypothetical protein